MTDPDSSLACAPPDLRDSSALPSPTAPLGDAPRADAEALYETLRRWLPQELLDRYITAGTIVLDADRERAALITALEYWRGRAEWAGKADALGDEVIALKGLLTERQQAMTDPRTTNAACCGSDDPLSPCASRDSDRSDRSDPAIIAVIDGRCGCEKCQARSPNLYRMIGVCYNCGAKPILMLFRAGDATRALDCPGLRQMVRRAYAATRHA